MAVMNEKIRAKGSSGEVVHAASAVSNVGEDEDVRSGGEGTEDVGQREGVHEKTFRELEGDAWRRGGERKDSVDGFVDFEVVIGWEERYCGV